MIASLKSSHFRNIFSAKFVPDGTNTRIVSCGMDGTVGLISDINQNKPNPTPLGCYNQMSYRVNFIPDSPETFLTTHQDGRIRFFDLREKGRVATEEETTNVLLTLRGTSVVSANTLAFKSGGEKKQFVVNKGCWFDLLTYIGWRSRPIYTPF
jgi:WD40 repeat protein